MVKRYTFLLKENKHLRLFVVLIVIVLDIVLEGVSQQRGVTTAEKKIARNHFVQNQANVAIAVEVTSHHRQTVRCFGNWSTIENTTKFHQRKYLEYNFANKYEDFDS